MSGWQSGLIGYLLCGGVEERLVLCGVMGMGRMIRGVKGLLYKMEIGMGWDGIGWEGINGMASRKGLCMMLERPVWAWDCIHIMRAGRGVEKLYIHYIIAYDLKK